MSLYVSSLWRSSSHGVTFSDENMKQFELSQLTWISPNGQKQNKTLHFQKLETIRSFKTPISRTVAVLFSESRQEVVPSKSLACSATEFV